MTAMILCVDDDRNFAELLAKAFRTEGYAVRTANDGETALQVVRESQPDLITLDLMLPRKDGFSVLEEIRALEGKAGQSPVVLLSGCTPTPRYRRRAMELSASALLTKPVPLERLLKLAAKETGAGARVRVQPKSSSGARPIAGSLAKVPFGALMHHLHGLRATGVLHLESGKKRKKLQLRDGLPVAVKSNLVDECLGNLLAATGKISWDVMDESLRRVKRGEGPQGQILVAMHMLDEEDLARALHTQAEEKLLEIFAWEEGRFRFQRGVRLRSANTLTLQRSPANLIMEGVRSRLPAAALERFFRAQAHARVTPGESPFYRFQDIQLSPEEEALLRACDGSEPLGQQVRALDEGAQRALYGAISTGLLEVRRDRPARRRGAAHASRSATARPVAASPQPPRVDESVRAEFAAMAERMRGKDFFSVLGVEQRTTDAEVRHAYVELAKRTHPDRFNDSGEAVRLLAEEVFGIVSEAYEALAVQDRRLAYLRSLRTQERDAAELDDGHRALRAELAFQKGEACLRNKEHAAAARHFQEAMQTYPSEGEYHAHFGWAHYLAGPDEPDRFEEALEHLREGRKLAPDREKPYLLLGKLYKSVGRARVAERMFSRALQLDPDCVEALRELRLVDMRRQRKRSKGLVSRILRR